MISTRKNETKNIPIQKPKKTEYTLTKNYFDPNECSPPNEFMIKLYMRMDTYTKKDDSLMSE